MMDVTAVFRFGPEHRRVLANIFFKAASLPLEKGCRLVVLLMAARVLGQGGFGSFQFAVTLTTLFALELDLGLSMWTVRQLGRSQPRAASIVRTAVAVRGIAAVPFVLAVGASAVAVGPGSTRHAIVLLGAASLATAFGDYFAAVCRAHERLDDEARLNVVRALLFAVAGLVALRAGRSVSAFAGGIAAASVLGTLFGLRLIRGRYRLLVRADGGRFDRAIARRALAEALPLWVATLLAVLYCKVDVILLRSMTGDAEVGAYGAAYKVLDGVMILPAAVLAATFPALARAYGDRERQRKWEILIVAILLGLGLVLSVSLRFAAAGLTRHLFGAAFVRAVPSLRVIALALPIMFVNFGLAHVLIARNRERLNLLISGAMVIVNVGLNMIAIPRLGGPGAAWATAGTELALMLSFLATARWWGPQSPARELGYTPSS
jgi:O-antigen/teichoic acid export membrane protein